MIVFRRKYRSGDKQYWAMAKVLAGDRVYTFDHDEDDDNARDQDDKPMSYEIHKKAWLVGKLGYLPGIYPFESKDFELKEEDDEVEIEDDED